MQKNKNPSTFSAWKIITEELESDNPLHIRFHFRNKLW